MKKWWAVVVLVAPLAVVLAAENVHDELIELDKKWGEANLKGDKAAVGNILADDVMGVFPRGNRGDEPSCRGLGAAPCKPPRLGQAGGKVAGRCHGVRSHRELAYHRIE